MYFNGILVVGCEDGILILFDTHALIKSQKKTNVNIPSYTANPNYFENMHCTQIVCLIGLGKHEAFISVDDAGMLIKWVPLFCKLFN